LNDYVFYPDGVELPDYLADISKKIEFKRGSMHIYFTPIEAVEKEGKNKGKKKN